MFGRGNTPGTTNRGKTALQLDVPIFFGIMFVLAIVEMVFTINYFIYKQKRHQFKSSSERSRLAFLIFSSARTIMLAAVYMGFHFARKYFHSMFHTIFLVLSTIFWIISGVLIHQLWGLVECGGVGGLKGGLNKCHELKIIEIIAWVLAVVSVLATVPVVMGSMKRHKQQKESQKSATSG